MTDAQMTDFLATMAITLGTIFVVTMVAVFWSDLRRHAATLRLLSPFMVPLLAVAIGASAGGFAGAAIGLVFGAAIVVAIVVGPSAVKRLQVAGADYVTSDDDESAVPGGSAQEPEREREPERPGNASAAPTPVDGKLYTADEIERITRRGRDQGAAEAIGLMQAWGLLPEAHRTAAMEALYGKRGRRWQDAQPLIDMSRDRHTPATATPIAGRPTDTREWAGQRDEEPAAA